MELNMFMYSVMESVRKDIVTGLELSDGIEVLSGLLPEDKVLMSQEEIENGNYVKVVE